VNKGRNLAKARNETTTIHAGHDQIDEHQIGSKRGRNIESLRPSVGHVGFVAEFFYQQTQGVSTVSVVIDYKNPKTLLGRWHWLLSFASVWLG
jgi:hypothetical protein